MFYLFIIIIYLFIALNEQVAAGLGSAGKHNQVPSFRGLFVPVAGAANPGDPAIFIFLFFSVKLRGVYTMRRS